MVVVARVALQHVAINGRMGLHAGDVLAVRGLVGQRVYRLRTVDFRKRIVLHHVTAGVMGRHGSVPKSHVDQSLLLLLMVTAGCWASSGTKVVHVFSLQLVLDTLSVRSVPNQRKNRPNALHKQGSLSGFSVVKGGLVMELASWIEHRRIRVT